MYPADFVVFMFLTGFILIVSSSMPAMMADDVEQSEMKLKKVISLLLQIAISLLLLFGACMLVMGATMFLINIS